MLLSWIEPGSKKVMMCSVKFLHQPIVLTFGQLFSMQLCNVNVALVKAYFTHYTALNTTF